MILKDVFNFNAISKDLISLKRTTKIMISIMLIATIVSFVFGNTYTPIDWLTLFTSIFMVISLGLVDEGKITNYVFGFLSCSGWLLIAIHNKLFGDVASQMFYILMQFVGIYFWNKNLESEDTVKSRSISLTKGMAFFIMTIIIYLIVLFTSKNLNGAQVYVDSMLLPLGIVGQFLMTGGYASQWICWLTIDALNVYIWFNQLTNSYSSSTLTFFILQVIMLINAIYGAIQWYRNKE